MTRLVVAAVLVLAAVAAGDALRGAERITATARLGDEKLTSAPQLVLGDRGDYVPDGPYLKTRILRHGREFLSREDLQRAFPVDVEGPIDISKVAVAPDGTLVLGLYRFPSVSDPQAAIEFWDGRRPVGGFPVPTGYFGGGMAFNRDGSLIALFSYDGELRGIFERDGTRLEGLPESFLVVD